MDAASLIKHSEKRQHKRVIKTGLSLFLHAVFPKNKWLFAALKKFNIKPTDFITQNCDFLVTVGLNIFLSIKCIYL